MPLVNFTFTFTFEIKICIKTEASRKLALKMDFVKNDTSEQSVIFITQFLNMSLVDRRSAEQTESPQDNGPRVEHYRFDFQQGQTPVPEGL
jgi:hypothetical protein